MEEDRIVLDWARHYAALVLIFVLSGLLAAGATLAIRPRTEEGWTIVVEKGVDIPGRQLGPVAEAIFRSAVVYQPVMSALAIRESPARFLSEHTDIRPVPETTTLIVVGRASTIQEAEAISGAMAKSLVTAFTARAGLGDLQLFGNPQPAPIHAGLSTPVGVVFGGAAGLWLGLATAILRYRQRRPVLSAAHARAILDPGGVVMLDREKRLLAYPGSARAWAKGGPNQRRLQGLGVRTEAVGVVRLVAPGASASAERRIRFQLSGELQRDVLDADEPDPDRSTDGETIVVCHPGTPLRQLSAAISTIEEPQRPGKVILLWIS